MWHASLTRHHDQTGTVHFLAADAENIARPLCGTRAYSFGGGYATPTLAGGHACQRCAKLAPRIVGIIVYGSALWRRNAGHSTVKARMDVIYSDGSAHRAESPRSGGSGADMYLQNAADTLEKDGFLPGREHYPFGGGEPLWQYCRNRNIHFNYSRRDVTAERDL